MNEKDIYSIRMFARDANMNSISKSRKDSHQRLKNSSFFYIYIFKSTNYKNIRPMFSGTCKTCQSKYYFTAVRFNFQKPYTEFKLFAHLIITWKSLNNIQYLSLTHDRLVFIQMK